MTSAGLTVRIWNDAGIARRDSDGFVNATAMCKANGREWFTYARAERTKEYIAALARHLEGSPQNCGDLVESITTGPNEFRGTWVHPRLAIDLARWISPAFAVWMDGWFLEAAGYHQPAAPQPQVQDHVTRAELEELQRQVKVLAGTTFMVTAILDRSKEHVTEPFINRMEAAIPNWGEVYGRYEQQALPLYDPEPMMQLHSYRAHRLYRRMNQQQRAIPWPCSPEKRAHAAVRLVQTARRHGLQVVTARDVLRWHLFGRGTINAQQAREFLREAAHRYRLGHVVLSQRGKDQLMLAA